MDNAQARARGLPIDMMRRKWLTEMWDARRWGEFLVEVGALFLILHQVEAIKLNVGFGAV